MATVIGYLPQTTAQQPLGFVPLEFEADQDLWDIIKSGTIKAFLNIAQGFTGTAESMVELFGYGPENEFLSNVTNNIRRASSRIQVNPDNKVEWVASVVSQAVPYMGAALLGGAFAGPVGAALVGFSVEGQNAYDEAKARGVSDEKANLERLVVGSINAVIEASQVGKMLGLKESGRRSIKEIVRLAKQKQFRAIGGEIGNLSKDILKNSVNEAIEEFLQESVSTFAPGIFEGKEALPLDTEGNVDWVAIGNRLGAAAVAGAVASPALSLLATPLPGEGYRIAPPNLGKVTEAQVLGMIDTVKNSDMPAGIKESRLKDLESWLGRPVEVEAEEDIARAQKLREKLSTLEETIRPKQQAQIKKERNVRIQEFKNRMNEALKQNNPRTGQPYTNTEAFYFAKAAMQGNMLYEFTPLLQDTFTEADMDFFRGEANRTDLYNDFEILRVNDAITKLFGDVEGTKAGRLPEPAEIDLLERIIGERAANSLRNIHKAQMTWGQKARRSLGALANLPRAIQASCDFSFGARQGILMLFLDRKAWWKGMISQYKAFGNPQVAKFQDLMLKTNPFYKLAQKSGVFVAEEGGGIGKAEEPFISSLSQEIPLVRRSELAYTAAGNTMRLTAFYNICEQWAGTGKTQSDYNQLAMVINHLSGRGDYKSLQKLAPVLNLMFFSPRLLASRVQSFTDLARVDSPTRKILAGTLVQAVSTGIGLLGLLWLMAKKDPKKYSVDLDPRSGDFGKFRIGNTRLDYFGGYTQIVRTVARLIPSNAYNAFGLGENVKSGATGEFYDQSMKDTIIQFLQTKLSPAAGLAVDLYRGEDFKGDVITEDKLAGQVWERIAPFFVQDVIDAWRYQGWDGMIPTSILGVHGVGAMTYPISKVSESTNVKNRISQMTFGKNWKDLGPDFQEALREHNPLIEEYERQAKKERLSKATSRRTLEEIRSSERYVLRNLKPEIKRELDSTLVSVGGLSRQIGSRWYLTDKKYSQYKVKTIAALNKILPLFVDLEMPRAAKQAIIEEVISKVKQNVRNEIMAEATFNDLKEML